MKRPEIISKARDLVKERGGQVLVAELLGVAQSSVSKALQPDNTSMDELRRRILLEFGGIEVDTEPSFIVRSVRKRATKRAPAKKRRAKK